MSTAAPTTLSPVALQPDEGEALWFRGVLATIKASAETTAGRVAVIEHLAPEGSGSPLHVHRREDEWFYVTEGELSFWVGGQVIDAPAGSFVYGPRDIPTPSQSPLARLASSWLSSPPASRTSCASLPSPRRLSHFLRPQSRRPIPSG